MRSVHYVALSADDRDELVWALGITSGEIQYSLEGLTYESAWDGKYERRAEREMVDIEIIIERLEQDIPVTRVELLRAVRSIEQTPRITWEYDRTPESKDRLRRAVTICQRVRAQCTNALRLARAQEVGA